MSLFAARLQLPGQSKLPLNVEVDVTGERMCLTTGDQRVGEWELQDLDIGRVSNGFRIKVDSEEMVLNVSEPERFAVELGVQERTPKQPLNGGMSPIGLDGPRIAQLRFEDLQARISEIAEAIASPSVEPERVFAKWLGLVKELNQRHGQGSLPSRDFYELNTQLLDLFPTPKRADRPS